VRGRPTRAQLARIRGGIALDDGPARAKRAWLVGAGEGRGAVRLVMTEGRKREVRRLLQEVGLPVTRLIRLRVGPIRLAGLPPGEHRELARDEVLALIREAEGTAD
jgi:23S rRNA pseudouridine2605 synthase